MILSDRQHLKICNREDLIKYELCSTYPDISLDRFPVTSVGIKAAIEEGIKPFLHDLEYKGLRRPILFYGPPGTGKTALASAIWNKIGPYIPDRSDLKSARNCNTADNLVWYRGDELPELWKNGDIRLKQSKQQSSIHQSTCLLMVIDDLDKCPGGGWAATLQGMLDSRLKSPELITIVTMNLTPAQFVRRYDKEGNCCGKAIIDRFRRRGGIFIGLKEKTQAVQPQEALID